MVITFYQFSKKNNSTKRPSAVGKDLTGDLKQDTSIITPQILISPLQGGIAPSSLYNYAYIPKFNRYYFVSDWVWVGNMWQVNLRLDVLASWKESIGTSSQYVTRSASAYNLNIPDGIYATAVDYNSVIMELEDIFVNAIANGFYIIGIINGEATDSFGAITYYQFTSANIGWLKSFLFSDDYLHNSIQATDVSDGLLKSMYNPYQYIASCLYFPIPPASIPGTVVSSIKFGWWSVDIPEGYRPKKLPVSALYGETSQTVSIGTHPQISRGEWLNREPYTQYKVYFPPWGLIPLNSSDFAQATDIGFTVQIDYISGVANLIIKALRNTTMQSIAWQESKQVGVPVQLAGMIVDVSQDRAEGVAMIKGAGLLGNLGQNVIGNLQSGNLGGVWSDIQGFASGAKSAFIDNIADFFAQSVHTSGVNGSTAIYTQDAFFMIRYYKIAGENLTHYGRPLCENRTINTLSGFILCADADIAIPGTLEERSAIVGYLNSGFFWE